MIFSRKPIKNYFIDSENVNDVWVAGIVNSLGKTDHIYIFYSENSTHMKSDSVRRLMELGSDRVTWIRCYIGTNALDFQLVTVLGAVTSDGKPEDECIIVSNDAGFDAVVQFWQDQGREVSRLKMDTSAGRTRHQTRGRRPAKKIQSQKPDLKRLQEVPKAQPKPVQEPPKQQQTQKPVKEAQKQQPAQKPVKEAPKQQPAKPVKEAPKQQQAKPVKEAQKQQPKPVKEAQKQQPVQKNEKVQASKTQKPQQPEKKNEKKPVELSKRNQAVLKNICRSISSKDAGQLHDALNALLGDQEGMLTYKHIKSSPALQQELSGILLPDKEARAANYVHLVYAVAGVDEKAAKDIITIYARERAKGLQAINLAMVKTFGQEQATKYYPDLKRHYRILEKICK